MDQKTKEAYDIQYRCIEEMKTLVTEIKARYGREVFSHIESFG